MTIAEFIKSGSARLDSAGIGSARLDCLILLEDLLGRDRAWLLAHQERVIEPAAVRKLQRQLERRSRHIPLAYIRGFSEFYGRKFKVNRHVLEPRPESETMIDLLKQLATEWPAGAAVALADVGTGTGCLGITAALELPNATVDLYDIDSSCLAVARHNCSLHELKLNLRKRDLLNRPLRRYDVVLANMPYVPNHWQINLAAGYEPRLAIFGGKDGLDHYRRLFGMLAKLGWQPLAVLTEALPPQHEMLAAIAAEHGFKCHAEQDFIQVFVKA